MGTLFDIFMKMGGVAPSAFVSIRRIIYKEEKCWLLGRLSLLEREACPPFRGTDHPSFRWV